MKYHHKKTEDGNFDIFREDKHVATYDPASEEVTFTSEENEKYAGPVGKEVQVILETSGGGSDPDLDGSEGDSATGADVKLEALKRQVKQLQAENSRLKHQIGMDPEEDPAAPRLPARFDDEVDESKAPKKDPQLGDLTPEYVEWARKTMPREVFVKRYARRIKDL